MTDAKMRYNAAMRRIVPCLALVLLPALGCAHTAVPSAGMHACHEVTLPEVVEQSGHALRLNGMAVREVTVFDVDVYVGALYLESVSSDADVVVDSVQRKRIVLRFIRDVTRADIVNTFERGFVANAGTERLGLSSEIAQFMTFFSDVDDGDEMRFDYAPDTGLTYSHNGEARGTIAGAEFGRAFFLVFVGAQPPSAALKAGLLGGRCD